MSAFGAPTTRIALRTEGINVVLGRNGAGKTALCRLIAGLDPAGDARVTLDGRDLTALDTRRRNVGLVFGEFVNYPAQTVAENIASPLRAAGLGADERARRVRDMAERLGLAALLERLPEQLSGGQQQRVALARALVKAPSILLLDEPLVNLDYKLRESLEDELRGLFAATDTVVVYTTSDPREALSLADHLVLLDRGLPIQQGAPLDLLRAPATPMAADLLCDPGVNLARARVDGARLQLGDGLSLPCPGHLHDRSEVILAIRPDHLQRVAEGTADALAGRVLLTETTGSDTYVHLALGGLEWVAHFDGLHRLEPGASLWVGVHASDLLDFEAADFPELGVATRTGDTRPAAYRDAAATH
ncbi:MAG TPA: ABC transporter ATP-binding protein [Pseudomonadales bacterium]|nr:ABC transporter ATP-binding protein [Pseudomonadales bacterium]